jgi:hypothetical protein
MQALRPTHVMPGLVPGRPEAIANFKGCLQRRRVADECYALALRWPGQAHGCPVEVLAGRRLRELPPPWWGRAGVGGRANPTDCGALQGFTEVSATPLPNPPPQGGRECSRCNLVAQIFVR